jgi:hypothetical protein
VTTKPGEAEPVLARPEGSQPEIKITYQPAGRETLEAITDELIPLPVARERESSSPEITVREGVIERDTLAAIMEEAGAGLAPEPTPVAPPDANLAPISAVLPVLASPGAIAGATPLEIFEMVTYVVRGTDVAGLASESLRRRFVEEHLLARLPVKSAAEIERVDVTPWTVQGTFVVRVWCRTGNARSAF